MRQPSDAIEDPNNSVTSPILGWQRHINTKNSSPTSHSPENKNGSNGWDKVSSSLVVGSNAANVGIGLDILSHFISVMRAIPGLDMLVLASESAIYGFKAVYHLCLLAYKKLSSGKAELEYRKYGWHRFQTAADVACITLFTLTIVGLCGFLFANPLGAAISWAMGLTGVSINIYFEYAYQAKKAKEEKLKLAKELIAIKEEYESVLNILNQNFPISLSALFRGPEDPDYQQQSAAFQKLVDKKSALRKAFLNKRDEFTTVKHDYTVLKDAKRLYIAVVIGLVFIFVCGSIAAIAPPAILGVFIALKYLGISMLALINIGRLTNHVAPQLKNTIGSKLGFNMVDPDEALMQDPEAPKADSISEILTRQEQGADSEPTNEQAPLLSSEDADTEIINSARLSGFFPFRPNSETSKEAHELMTTPACA